MTRSRDDCAAFWIAHREKFIREARRSAKRVERKMPALRRYLFTPDRGEKAGRQFHELRQLPERKYDRFWYWNTPLYFSLAVKGLKQERLLYFDTDTWMCEAIWDMLELLDQFDFVGCHAPGRIPGGSVDPVPEAFPQFNIGVLAFRNNDRVRWILDRWVERHDRHRTVYGNNDQGSLRETLYHDGKSLRLWVAPPEYNCRFKFGGFAKYPVRVLHGRVKNGNRDSVCRKLNESEDMRGWRRGEIE